MGWHEVMKELEAKLEGTLSGTYRPLDNVPFFRVQYPPAEEREAIRQFHQFAERLKQRGWKVECVSLTEVYQQAMARLLGCPLSELTDRLKTLEKERERSELQRQLSEHLPGELANVLKERLREMPRGSAAILLRMGSLYPFVRPSSLASKLEGQVDCAIVLPYPGTNLGALLDAPPADHHGGYYRGEVIAWK
jgi:hypothetical protein